MNHLCTLLHTPHCAHTPTATSPPQLKGLINKNYSRIKDVEKELAGLQLQLKLTSGPKRSALEMLRKKIEAQNEKVLAARKNQQRARAMAASAEEVLAAEERVKDKLCQELNLLIQESAHAQLDKLDQLTRRLELLNRDLTVAEVDLSSEGDAEVARAHSAPGGGADSSGDASKGAAASQPAAGSAAPQPAPPQPGSAPQPAPQPAGASTNPFETPTPAPAKAAVDKEKARQAQQARARHVQLPTDRRPARGAAPQQQVTPQQATPPRTRPTQSSGAFQGFDA